MTDSAWKELLPRIDAYVGEQFALVGITDVTVPDELSEAASRIADIAEDTNTDLSPITVVLLGVLTVNDRR